MDQEAWPGQSVYDSQSFSDLSSWTCNEENELSIEINSDEEQFYFRISKHPGGWQWEWGYSGEDWIDRSKELYRTEQQAHERLRAFLVDRNRDT